MNYDVCADAPLMLVIVHAETAPPVLIAVIAEAAFDDNVVREDEVVYCGFTYSQPTELCWNQRREDLEVFLGVPQSVHCDYSFIRIVICLFG